MARTLQKAECPLLVTEREGRPRRSWQMYLSLIREFRAMAAALGIGPAARAALVGDLAVAHDKAAAAAQAELSERYGRKA
jgi:hypothetical protein